MQLNLAKPICFFDLETTGTNVSKDRIVEISILKINPNGEEISKTWLVNPQVPIPKEASDIHGITDEKVADQPAFREIAPEVQRMLKDSDLAGYNSNRFDIPMLAEEMLRIGKGFEMDNRYAVDVQNIFHKMEQRTLSAAYKFYCNKNLDDAHSAEADTLATYEILKAQLERYSELENNIKALDDFSRHHKTADLAGFITYNEKGKEIFSFGKHKGKTVQDILNNDPGYFNWILNSDFPSYTKKILTEIKLRNSSML
jgi:DNA polymerase-3 subunit epsilon